jgi:hypothetical protein
MVLATLRSVALRRSFNAAASRAVVQPFDPEHARAAYLPVS